MKKRYAVTLTKEVFDEVKASFRVLGLPPSTMSALLDDLLANFAPVVKKMADRKQKGEQLTFQEVVSDLLMNASKSLEEPK